MKTTWFVYIS